MTHDEFRERFRSFECQARLEHPDVARRGLLGLLGLLCDANESEELPRFYEVTAALASRDLALEPIRADLLERLRTEWHSPRRSVLASLVARLGDGVAQLRELQSDPQLSPGVRESIGRYFMVNAA